jgi:ATP phosphoribosyltransferase
VKRWKKASSERVAFTALPTKRASIARPLSIVIPNKGRLSEGARALLRDAGFKFSMGERAYACETRGFRVLFARTRDIPFYVEGGFADVGITGKDIVAETNARVSTLIELPFSFCRLVLAARENNGIECARDLDGRRVATSFPNITQTFLESQKVQARVVRLEGAVEASVGAGIADAVVDLTSSGATLRANGLREIECLLKSSAVLIANRSVAESAEVAEFVEKLAREAKKKC